MVFVLGKGSKRNLEGVHPLLVQIVNRAIQQTAIDFSVVDGIRTLSEQRRLVDIGKSWTMNSYHIPRRVKGVREEVGMAVDIYPWVDGKSSHSEEYYKEIAKVMFRASQELKARLEWGGLWDMSYKDMPHWQLKRW